MIGSAQPENADSSLCNIASREALKLLVKEKDDRIEIITASSSKDLQKEYHKALTEVGYHNFDFLCVDIEEHKLPDENLYARRLAKARTVFFAGDRSEVYTALKNTAITDFLRNKYLHEDHFTLAGINAGAMYISDMMMNGFNLLPGLGFINNCIVDTQFVHRTRFEKLAHAVILHREYLGVGLGEGTALIIEEGYRAFCKGSGTVMVINAKDVKKYNVESVKKGRSVYVKNLKGHILIDGCTINLSNGRVA